MTHFREEADGMVAAAGQASQQPASTGTPRGSKTWRARLVLLLITGAIAAYLINTLPPYLTLNPKEVRIILNPDFPAHYGVLLAHIAFGTIALVTVCLQIWPWLRRKHPRIHRLSGRVYVFAGAVPCALLALVLDRVTYQWEANLGITMQGLLLLVFTIAGYVAVRRRNYASHRRWMLYSFAMVTSVVWGRAAVVLYIALPASARPNVDYLLEFARWFNWMINLVLVQWWLEHDARRSARKPSAAAGPGQAPKMENSGHPPIGADRD